MYFMVFRNIILIFLQREITITVDIFRVPNECCELKSHFWRFFSEAEQWKAMCMCTFTQRESVCLCVCVFCTTKVMTQGREQSYVSLEWRIGWGVGTCAVSICLWLSITNVNIHYCARQITATIIINSINIRYRFSNKSSQSSI